MRPHTPLRRWAGWLWASPNTLLGLVAGLVLLLSGGGVARERGVLEFSGGWLGERARCAPAAIRFTALTLGHTILGTCAADLAAVRDHEHVHVRQYERWGPFFLPAYAVSSLWQVLHGRRGYRDNVFERQAYAADAVKEQRT